MTSYFLTIIDLLPGGRAGGTQLLARHLLAFHHRLHWRVIHCVLKQLKIWTNLLPDFSPPPHHQHNKTSNHHDINNDLNHSSYTYLHHNTSSTAHITMSAARSLTTLPGVLRSRLPQRTILPACRQQVRHVNTDREELGGVGGSEPPSPKKNPVNWRAGTITGVGVGLACGLMLWSKKKDAKI